MFASVCASVATVARGTKRQWSINEKQGICGVRRRRRGSAEDEEVTREMRRRKTSKGVGKEEEGEKKGKEKEGEKGKESECEEELAAVVRQC